MDSCTRVRSSFFPSLFQTRCYQITKLDPTATTNTKDPSNNVLKINGGQNENEKHNHAISSQDSVKYESPDDIHVVGDVVDIRLSLRSYRFLIRFTTTSGR